MAGEIVNNLMLDSVSARSASEGFPPYPIGGLMKVLEGPSLRAPKGLGISTTFGMGRTNSDGSPNASVAPMAIMDPLSPSYPPVPCSPCPIIPTVLPRTELKAIVNTTVFFGGDRVAVVGDAMIGPGANPEQRLISQGPLTPQTTYPKIIIGTRRLI